MFAVINMHAATVATLLKLGADVNAQSDLGFTPLILAACSGDAGIAQALLNSGADVGKTLKSGQTALSHAAEHGYNDIVELLKRAVSKSTEGKSLTASLKAEA
jgi:ankyrin repeat protein